MSPSLYSGAQSKEDLKSASYLCVSLLEVDGDRHRFTEKQHLLMTTDVKKARAGDPFETGNVGIAAPGALA